MDIYPIYGKGNFTGMYVAITARPTPNSYLVETVHCIHKNHQISGTIDSKCIISLAKERVVAHLPVHGSCQFDGEVYGPSIYLRYQDICPNSMKRGHFVLRTHATEDKLTGMWSGVLHKQIHTASSIWLRFDGRPNLSPGQSALLQRIEALFATEKELIELAKMNSDRIRLRLGKTVSKE